MPFDIARRLTLPDLPILEALPALHAALQAGPAAVLHAPPGAGKTTVVPLALLDAPWLAGGTILMLEPRRLAARAAALRMADVLQQAVGQTVGYRVRFEAKVSAATRIEVVTEGILTRRLQSDPALDGVGMVIFDEFHERSIHADLALALCLDAQQVLREDLRLLVMSATLDTDAVCRILGGAPLVSSAGRAFPVDIRYVPRDLAGDPTPLLIDAVRRALREHTGDVLAFLPGAGEIRRAQQGLQNHPDLTGMVVYPLFGDLARDAQDRALQPDPQGRRKVVLATDIAQTSLTIEGVRSVVDSGYTRRPRFDPASGLTRLETVRIARDAAEQRAGRAGRVAPGQCYRLWSEATQRSLSARTPAEIQSADLAALALD